MSQMTLTKTSLAAGHWQGELRGAGEDAPELSLTCGADPVEGLSLEKAADDGVWHVRAAIPADRIMDGMQTFVIAEAATGARLASFAILAGEALSDDIRAEVDLLRAELDLLKHAFRRHCAESGISGD